MRPVGPRPGDLGQPIASVCIPDSDVARATGSGDVLAAWRKLERSQPFTVLDWAEESLASGDAEDAQAPARRCRSEPRRVWRNINPVNPTAVFSHSEYLLPCRCGPHHHYLSITVYYPLSILGSGCYHDRSHRRVGNGSRLPAVFDLPSLIPPSRVAATQYLPFVVAEG